jgi:hypothetical protein
MNKAWLIAGAVAGCLAGVTMGACGGSGNGTTTTGTGGTSGSTTGPSGSTSGTGGTASTSSTTAGTGGTTTTSSGTGGTGGSTVDAGECGKVTTLHPPNLDAGPGTIYCPFSATTDGGKNEYCTPETQHCCVTPEGSPTASACEPTGTACITGATDWQCEDPLTDCPSGMICCSNSGASLGIGTPAGTCGNYAHKMTGTQCVAAGMCNGIQMCTSDAECPTGQTCTPFAKGGNDVGGCM